MDRLGSIQTPVHVRLRRYEECLGVALADERLAPQPPGGVPVASLPFTAWGLANARRGPGPPPPAGGSPLSLRQPGPAPPGPVPAAPGPSPPRSPPTRLRRDSGTPNP